MIARCLIALGCCWALMAAEPQPDAAPTPVSGWRFPPGIALFYEYRLQQDVAWRSAGDDLAYRSAMTWIVALRATAVDGPTATVNATVISLQATLDGPAAQVRVDTREPATTSDPVYGHLAALAGVTLTLTVDQPTGRVARVTGGEAIIQQINRQHPASVPGDPPPLAAAAAKLYSEAALAAWWTQVLAQPGAEPQTVPLAAPLTGNLVRTWTGDRFTLALPAGTTELPVTLVEGVNAVAGTLTGLTGAGQLTMVDGVATQGAGELAYTLRLTALTQAVEQQHRQRWSLKPIVTPLP